MKSTPSLHFLPKLLLSAVTCTVIFSCAFQDELLTTRNAYYRQSGITKAADTDGFFSYTDSLLTPIVRTLQQIEADTPFVETFMQTYGIPLWDNTYLQSDAEGVNFYVPLYNHSYPNIIHSVWVFCVADDKMTYAPIHRPETTDINEQTVFFDLLSYLTFGEKNATGQTFKPHAQTREWVVVTECWDAYAGGEEEQEYKYTVCVDKTVWRETVDDYISDGEGGGGSGNDIPIIPPGGGGNEDGGDKSAGKKAKTLFSSKLLDKQCWAKIDTCIMEIESKCMGEALCNKLRSMLKDKKINLEIIKDGAPAYNWEKNTLKFNPDNPESDVLLHELWHACQYYQNKELSFKSKLMNMEVEARYAQYLFMKKTGKWDSLYKEQFSRMPSWRAINYINDYLNEKAQIRSEQIQELYNTYIEYTVVPQIHKDDEDYKTYSFKPEEADSTFSLIQELIKNCNP